MWSLRVDDEIEVRLLEERHADELFALTDANRGHLRRWLPWVEATRSADDTRAFIKTVLEAFAAGREYGASIRYRGELLGGIGLDVNRDMGHGEIGYWLAKPLEGKGIVTRATAALTTAAFGEIGLDRTHVLCAVGNGR